MILPEDVMQVECRKCKICFEQSTRSAHTSCPVDLSQLPVNSVFFAHAESSLSSFRGGMRSCHLVLN